MSANASISEGGKGYPFGPVKCLMVEGDNGEFYPWYPEADRALDSLSVDKNGIYRASDRGIYGWNRVSVNVPQTDRVTGRDPETGQEVTVTADPETGELVETVIPVEIRVIAPPTNPYGTYLDGQTITKDGMVVKAYDNNGDDMQIVPIGEIAINPTVAVYDPDKDTRGEGKANIDQSVLIYPEALNLPLSYNTNGFIEYPYDGDKEDIFTADGAITFCCMQEGNAKNIWALSTSNTAKVIEVNTIFDVPRTIIHELTMNLNTLATEKKVYYVLLRSSTYTINGIPVNNASATPRIDDIATVLFDGERQDMPAGSPQAITVSWPRPGDGAILETSFDILVGPRGGQGDD